MTRLIALTMTLVAAGTLSATAQPAYANEYCVERGPVMVGGKRILPGGETCAPLPLP